MQASPAGGFAGLKRLWSSGSAAVQVEASHLFKRASSYFGTWGKALAAAGVPVDGDRSIGAELRGLRPLRLARKMTIRQLAERSGLTGGHVSQLERGIYRPTAATADALSKAMGVTIAVLVGAEAPERTRH